MLMQAMVDGLVTQYEMRGKGKTVLLLHGWGDRAAGLKLLADSLSKYFTVIVPDLPGFGGTASPPEAWDLSDYSRFVAHFLHKIGAQDVYAVLGHSNGGAIAVRGLGRATFSADKLVLVASAGIRGTYNARTKIQRMVVKAGKAAASPLPRGIKQKLRRRVYDAIGSDMLVAEHLQETFKKVVTDDVRQDAARITIPVLLVYGEDDLATPVHYGELFHEVIDGSTLEVISGAGHFVYLDRPHEVTNAVLEFLQ